MTMTRQHFQLIADEFKQVLKTIGQGNGTEYTKGQYDSWYILVMNFTNTLKNTNPQFDTDKFLRACGLKTQAELDAQNI